jgi:hypothetical protein
MLARLANETGGRLTHNTNDLSLGFARAQRDLGCQYTLGFYLTDDVLDAPRNVSVRVKRDGLRALHPDKYLFRSEEARWESDMSAAFHAPAMFQTGYVSAHVFLLQPKSKGVWETLVAVNFPVSFDGGGAESTIDFGAVLRRGSKVIHAFNRRVALRQKPGTRVRDRRFLFLEPADLEPGTYELTVVAADVRQRGRPEALRTNLDVPGIPTREPMLVQPILGRPRDANVVVRGDGPTGRGARADSEKSALHDVVAARGSFEPMLVQRLENAGEVLTRNKACLVGRKEAPTASIERTVMPQDDDEALRLRSVALELAEEGKVLCQNVFEVLPEGRIDDGRYLFEATIDAAPESPTARETLPFAVADPVRD